MRSENAIPNDGDLVRRAMSIDISLDSSPDVSIIIPVYGEIAYTLMCLESIAECMPEGSYEVIVVDDGSTDKSLLIAKSFRSKFGAKIVIIHQEKSGANAARNAGIEGACGVFIQFLDCDDWIENNKLAKSYSAFLNNRHLK